MNRLRGARLLAGRHHLVGRDGPVSDPRLDTRPADPLLGRLHAECAARGDACLDSARVVPAAAPGQFTFAHDPHWNREGHRRIGEALADVLGRDPALRRVRTSRPP